MELTLNILSNALLVTILGIIINYIFKSKLDSQQNNFQEKLESLKTDLHLSSMREQDKIEQKREVYISLIDTMSIFIKDRVEADKQDQYIRKFLKDYDTVWLWGNDDVIKAISYFLKINNKKDTGDIHQAYANVIVEMRKDLGFKNTNVKPIDYEFVSPPKK